MATLDQDYDIAVVLDADNMMAPDFSKINAAFENDFIAVQGHRAKIQIVRGRYWTPLVRK
jgi:hypothetical protein